MWYFKDGVRTKDDLSLGQREVIESMGAYEGIYVDIDTQLEYFLDNGY